MNVNCNDYYCNLIIMQGDYNLPSLPWLLRGVDDCQWVDFAQTVFRIDKLWVKRQCTPATGSRPIFNPRGERRHNGIPFPFLVIFSGLCVCRVTFTFQWRDFWVEAPSVAISVANVVVNSNKPHSPWNYWWLTSRTRHLISEQNGSHSHNINFVVN